MKQFILLVLLASSAHAVEFVSDLNSQQTEIDHSRPIRTRHPLEGVNAPPMPAFTPGYQTQHPVGEAEVLRAAPAAIQQRTQKQLNQLNNAINNSR